MNDRILIVHGPNLNLLGTREPEVYGALTLSALDRNLIDYGKSLGVEVETFQSNHEGEIVTMLQEAMFDFDGVVANFGAYTHTSIAIRDAIGAIDLPVVEVHISNVHAREPFRHHSYVSAVCAGTVFGFGWQGYLLGIQGLIYRLGKDR